MTQPSKPTKRHNNPRDLEYLDKVSVRINFRLIAVIAAICVSAAVGGFFLRRFFLGRNSEIYLELAKRKYAEGERTAAIKDIGSYLRLRPNDDDARLLAVDWLEESRTDPKRRVAAYQLLADYVVRRPDDVKSRLRLMRLAISQGRFDAVLSEHLGPLAKQVGTDYEVTRLVALCRLRKSEFELAASLYMDAITIDPTKAENYYAFLEIAANSAVAIEKLSGVADRLRPLPNSTGTGVPAVEPKSEEGADENADLNESGKEGKHNEENPEGVELTRDEFVQIVFNRMERDVRPSWMYSIARIDYLIGQGELEESRTIADGALAEFPTEPELILAGVRSASARIQLARRLEDEAGAKEALDEAMRLTDLGLKLENPPLGFYEVRSRLLLELREPEASREALREGLAVLKSRIETGAMGSDDRSLEWQFVFQWGIANSLLLGGYEVSSAERRKIDAELVEMLDGLKQIGVRAALIELLESRKLMSTGQWREAATRLESTREDLKDFKEAKRSLDLSLVECFARLENPGASIEVLTRAIAEDPLWQGGRIFRANLYAMNGMEELAMAEFGKSMTVGEVPASVLRLVIRRQMKLPPEQRDWTAVENTLSRLEERHREDTTVRALRVEVLFQQANFVGANDHLVEARKADPKNAPLTEAHVLLTMSRTDIPLEQRVREADKIVAGYESEVGDSAETRLMRGELRIMADGTQAAATILKLGDDLNSMSEDDAGKLLRGLAEMAKNEGIDSVARELWTKSLKYEPRNIVVLLRLADLAVRQSDAPRLKEYLELVRGIEGANGPNSAFLEGVSFLRQAGAINKTGNATERSERNRLLELGVSQMKLALKGRPSWSEAHRLLGLANEELGLVRDSQIELTRAFELGDRAPETIQLIVEHLFRDGRHEEVLQFVSRAEGSNASVLPDNVRQRAAVSAFRLRLFDDAQRQISGKHSGDSTDKLFRAQIELSKGESGPKVEELLEEATHDAPDRPLGWFMRVSYFADRNRRETALKVIEEASQRVPAEPEHLKPLTLGLCYEAVDDLENAERELAKSHTGRTDAAIAIYEHVNFCMRHGKVLESQKLLTLLLDSNTKITKEQRAQAIRFKAELQAASATNYAEFDEAIKILGGGKPIEEVLTEDLRSQLAALSRSRIRKDLVRQILIYEELTRRQETASQDQFRIAQLNEEAGRWPIALAIYRELISAEPDNADVLASLLAGALPRHKITPDKQLLRDIESAAALLERLEPDSFRLAHFKSQLLAIQGRVNESVAILGGFLNKLGKMPAGKVFSTLLRTGRADYTIASLRRQIDPEKNPDAQQVLANLQQMIQSGNEANAIRSLAPVLESPGIRAIMQGELIRLVAISLEDLGDDDAAEKTIREYVKTSTSPDAPLVLASFQARHQDPESAIKIVESLDGKVSDLAIARSYVSIVRVGRVSPAQSDLVADRLTRLRERAKEIPERNAIEITIADLMIFHAKYAEASLIYQKILEAEPDNVIALNNLAWLTSFDNNRATEALGLVKRSIDQAGPLPDLLDTHGMIYVNINQGAQAVAILKALVDDSPTPTLWFHLALAQEQANDHAEATKSRDQALATGFQTGSLSQIERVSYKALLQRLGLDGG